MALEDVQGDYILMYCVVENGKHFESKSKKQHYTRRGADGNILRIK
jgi:hypothetical protein